MSENNLPNNLNLLKEYGLEIHFCKDIKSYTKLVPALQEFPGDIIVTVDDDIFYHKNMLKKLKECYADNPNKICCNRAHEICIDEKGNIKPYRQWQYEIKKIKNSKLIFPTGVGGILYPPNSLHSMTTDSNLFLKLAPTADDIWFWAMAKLQGTETCLTEKFSRQIYSVNITEELSMALVNTNIVENANDWQLKNLLEKFQQLKSFKKGEYNNG